MADDKPTDASTEASERPSLRPATGSGLGLSSLRPSGRGSSGGLSRLTGARDNSGGAGPLLPQPREQKKEDGPARRELEVKEEEEEEDDGEEPEIHPLFQEWTFWFDKRSTQQFAKKREQAHYENNLKRVGEFEDVETFWQYFNNMQPSSQIELNANYHLFRSGVKPMWEDNANKNGGKWTVQIRGPNARSNLDLYWKNVVLAMIGELLDEHDDVMGAVMSRRGKADRIAVWNRSRDNEERVMSLGRKIKELIVTNIDGPHELPMEYNGHDDSLRTGTSYSNPSKWKL